MKQQILFSKKTPKTKRAGLHILIILLALTFIGALHAYPVNVATSIGKHFILHDVCDSTTIREIKCSLEDATGWATGIQTITLNDKILDNNKTAGDYALSHLTDDEPLIVTSISHKEQKLFGASCKTWSPSGKKLLPTVTENE